MKLLIIVGLYFIAASMIYGVLAALAKKVGRLTPRMEKGIVALSLLWPAWPQLAVPAAVAYVLYKGFQLLDAPKPQQGNQ